MKALSIKPEWATKILLGAKTVECRSWKTDYRGDLLICASSQNAPGCIAKHALCVVTLEDIVEFTPDHLLDAFMIDLPNEGDYAWILSNVRFIEPFELKGKLHLYEVDDKLIKFVNMGKTSRRKVLEKYYEPLVSWKFRGSTPEENREYWDKLAYGRFEKIEKTGKDPLEDLVAEYYGLTTGELQQAFDGDRIKDDFYYPDAESDFMINYDRRKLLEPEDDGDSGEGKTIEYKNAELKPIKLTLEQYCWENDDELCARMQAVIEAESPIDKNRLFRLVMHSCGVNADEGIVGQRNEWLLCQIPCGRMMYYPQETIWKMGSSPEFYDDCRDMSGALDMELKEIPYIELFNALWDEACFHAPVPTTKEMVKRMAKRLGLDNRKKAVADLLRTLVEEKYRDGMLVRDGKGYSLNPDLDDEL